MKCAREFRPTQPPLRDYDLRPEFPPLILQEVFEPREAIGMLQARAVLVQALAAMAWVDGYLDPKQEAILKELFLEDQIDPKLAEAWLKGPVEFPSVPHLEGLLPDGSDRLDLVTQLLTMALTDRWIHPGEAELMRRLGESFGIDEQVLAELDKHTA